MGRTLNAFLASLLLEALRLQLCQSFFAQRCHQQFSCLYTFGNYLPSLCCSSDQWCHLFNFMDSLRHTLVLVAHDVSVTVSALRSESCNVCPRLLHFAAVYHFSYPQHCHVPFTFYSLYCSWRETTFALTYAELICRRYISLPLLGWNRMVERATWMLLEQLPWAIGKQMLFHQSFISGVKSLRMLRHSSYVRFFDWCQKKEGFHPAMLVSCHFVLATIQVQVCVIF